jgi:hypothetical protein
LQPVDQRSLAGLPGVPSVGIGIPDPFAESGCGLFVFSGVLA